jgi:general stress protein YciG
MPFIENKMTSQSPRIYIYKITFEEVLYYYYGVHKEKKFGEYYVGSPVTNKWVWDFYTPKKQILEVFPYTDEGWLEAQKVEKRLIKPFYQTDKWCLNESCGGIISLDSKRKNGKKCYEQKKGCHSLPFEVRSEISKKNCEKLYEEKRGIFAIEKEKQIEINTRNGHKNYEEKIGIFSLTPEERSEVSRMGGNKSYELGVGIHSMSPEERKELNKKLYEEKRGIYSLTPEERSDISSKNGKKLYEDGRGLFSLTPEEKSEAGKKGGKVTNSQKWMCLETGYITTSGPLTKYQRARDIDTSKRIRIS